MVEIKSNYIVTGVAIRGNEVKLVLDNIVVKEKPSPTSIVGNISGFVNQMKIEGQKVNDPNQLYVSTDDFNKLKLDLGDSVSIIVEKG